MNKDLTTDILSAFYRLNRAKTFFIFQKYMHGENLFMHKLVELGGQSSPSDLAREMGYTMPRASAILRSLELKKLVKRSVSEQDKRKSNIVITEKGREWVEISHSEIFESINTILDRLGEDDTKELARILHKFSKIDQSCFKAASSETVNKTNDDNDTTDTSKTGDGCNV